MSLARSEDKGLAILQKSLINIK